MNAHFAPEKPEPPLTITAVSRTDLGDIRDARPALAIEFNRRVSDDELAIYSKGPAAPQMIADLQAYASRLMAAELVARLFDFYIMGSIVLPDTPAAMDWLRAYMKGDGHGPLGHPLRWPICASATNLLTRWGYVSVGGFVGKAPAR